MAKTPKDHNVLVDPAKRKEFIEMRDYWSGLDQRAKSATGKRRQYEKEAKSAGFSPAMFKDSLLMETPEGEAEFRAAIATRLLTAAYSGADIGDQLGLFLDNNRTPAVDRAYREGQACAMQNKAAVPKYDPDTEQYRAFMTGYGDEQGRQVKAGISKLDPDAAKANGKAQKGAKAAKPAKVAKPKGKPGRPAKAAGAAPKDEAPPRRPTAAPATRASLAAEKAKGAQTDAESYFSKSEPAGNA